MTSSAVNEKISVNGLTMRSVVSSNRVSSRRMVRKHHELQRSTSLLTFLQDDATRILHIKLSRWGIDCAIKDKVRQILFFFFFVFSRNKIGLSLSKDVNYHAWW